VVIGSRCSARIVGHAVASANRQQIDLQPLRRGDGNSDNRQMGKSASCLGHDVERDSRELQRYRRPPMIILVCIAMHNKNPSCIVTLSLMPPECCPPSLRNHVRARSAYAGGTELHRIYSQRYPRQRHQSFNPSAEQLNRFSRCFSMWSPCRKRIGEGVCAIGDRVGRKRPGACRHEVLIRMSVALYAGHCLR
jgi:hypothetical protein